MVKDAFPSDSRVAVDGDSSNRDFLSSMARNTMRRHIVYIAEIVTCNPRDSLWVAWQ